MFLVVANTWATYAGWSKWLARNKYQVFFNYQVFIGRYPAEVQIGNFEQHVRYRSDFCWLPPLRLLHFASRVRHRLQLESRGCREFREIGWSGDGGVLNMCI